MVVHAGSRDLLKDGFNGSAYAQPHMLGLHGLVA